MRHLRKSYKTHDPHLMPWGHGLKQFVLIMIGIVTVALLLAVLERVCGLSLLLG